MLFLLFYDNMTKKGVKEKIKRKRAVKRKQTALLHTNDKLDG